MKKTKAIELLTSFIEQNPHLVRVEFVLPASLAPRPQGGRPTDEILKVLAAFPGGISTKDVINLATPKVYSKSNDPRKVVSTTLSSLARYGKCRREGHVYFPNEVTHG